LFIFASLIALFGGAGLVDKRAEMTTMSFAYIDVLYNRKRQHSTLGYKSPFSFWMIGLLLNSR
jgi:hypothetical protein